MFINFTNFMEGTQLLINKSREHKYKVRHAIKICNSHEIFHETFPYSSWFKENIVGEMFQIVLSF